MLAARGVNSLSPDAVATTGGLRFSKRKGELLQTHNIAGRSQTIRDIIGRTIISSGASEPVPSVCACDLLKSPDVGKGTVFANVNNAFGQSPTRE